MSGQNRDGESSETRTAGDERIFKVIMQEKQFLRDELRHLKDCQLRYVVLAVGGTGGFFALISTRVFNGTENNMHWLSGVIFLTPLLFVIPCSYIFFDKARSISRLVGYFRLLEAWCSKYNDKAQQEYIGWEIKLRDWRNQSLGGSQESDGAGSGKRQNAMMRVLLKENARNKYWFMIYRIFYVIAVGLIIVQAIETSLVAPLWKDRCGAYSSIPILVSAGSIIVAGYLVFFAFSRLAAILLELVEGGRSYNFNEKRWWKLHGVEGEELNKRLGESGE